MGFGQMLIQSFHIEGGAKNMKKIFKQEISILRNYLMVMERWVASLYKNIENS